LHDVPVGLIGLASWHWWLMHIALTILQFSDTMFIATIQLFISCKQQADWWGVCTAWEVKGMLGQEARSRSDMAHDAPIDNLRQRTYLRQRRAQLRAQVDAFREQANDYWQKAWNAERAGSHSQAQELERQAANSEIALARLIQALQSVEDELSELIKPTNG
jgi:hypothetical protein